MRHTGSSCSFDTSVNNISQLKNNCLRERENESSDFGSWVSTPRKRKSKKELKYTEEPVKTPKTERKLTVKSDTYYKRYRVDPLEGTFKHYANHAQYIKLYRETTTLCYKQRTLQELTSMYTAALDINRTSGQLPPANPLQADMMFVKENHQIPPINSRSESGVPLMLLPTPPSIPTRITQGGNPNSMPQAAFMCNAYQNKTIVCPIHRLIHRRNSVLNSRCKGSYSSSSNTVEHIKVELPGIPRRGQRVDLTRQSKGATPVQDEDEDHANEHRINHLLAANNPSSPSERITKALSGPKRTPIPSMQLPVTALLQYSPTQIPAADAPAPKGQGRTKRPLKSQLISQKNVKQKPAGSVEQAKPKPDVKQVNYEQQYDKFFTDVLESKGRNTQKKHFQSLSTKP